MTKKKWIIVIIILILLWILWACSYWFIHFDMKGDSILYLKVNEMYQEPGITAKFMGKPLRITFTDTIESEEEGKYKVTYSVKSPLGIARKKTRTIIVTNQEGPSITLKGLNPVSIKVEEPYQEAGATAKDPVDGNLTNKIKIENKVNIHKAGSYEVIYRVKNSLQRETVVKRTVTVTETELTYQARYDKIDNTKKTWWSSNKKDQTRPVGAVPAEDLKKYNAYFMGNDDKTIYLTFDEGDDKTYVDQIVDVLNANQVKATFFLCRNFIVHNQELMKKLVATGHSVGNHTYHHNNMADYANKTMFPKYLSEIRLTEQAFFEATGKPMDKIYREPRGDWSYRSLEIVKDMGYKSFFWSADYLDWDGEKTKEYALEQLMKRYHNGAIYLIHPKTKGNYEAMDDFIKKLKALGYEFGLVRDIN